MMQVKRMEIVIDQAHTPALLKMLREAGAPGYTVIRDVQGTGDRGDRGGDQLSDVYRNCYVMVAAPETLCTTLIESIRPMLERFGGVCLVSEASLIRHR